MYDKTQLFKGVLEGCVLQVISREATYGYKIVAALQEHGFGDLKEGTIYPILLRLEKNGHITAEFRPSPMGPDRKYYTVTPKGQKHLQAFLQSWNEINRTIDQIFQWDSTADLIGKGETLNV